MNFVLDASVTMAWLLGASKPADRAYAQGTLEALKHAKAARKAGVKRFTHS